MTKQEAITYLAKILKRDLLALIVQAFDDSAQIAVAEARSGARPCVDEDCPQFIYNRLQPYLDEMWIEGLSITPLSLEAYYHHKGSKLEYSHAVLEATIVLWKAYRTLEVALRSEWGER